MSMDINAPAAEARTTYTYSATGAKLRVKHNYSSGRMNGPVNSSGYSQIIGKPINTAATNLDKTLIIDYAGNKVYENNTLKRVLVDGGYIEGTTYYFFITDHLGSNRVVANTSGTAIQNTHYYPFGTAFAESTGQEKQPYKYNGKELDLTHGLNLYDYSARYMDSPIGRFTSVDPLAEKYYSWSPYSYCFNNPIRWIDKDGRDPGDPFKTRIEAANDFAKYYNGTSIIKNTEFASLIYKSSDGSYSYNVARIGGRGWSIPNFDIPKGTTEAAGIHTHGGEDPELDSYNFSQPDKDSADKAGVNEYVVIAGGHLFEYDVETKKENKNVENAATDIPSDPNSPKRVNEVDAKDTKPHYIDVQYLSDPNRRIVDEYNKPEKK